MTPFKVRQLEWQLLEAQRAREWAADEIRALLDEEDL